MSILSRAASASTGPLPIFFDFLKQKAAAPERNSRKRETYVHMRTTLLWCRTVCMFCLCRFFFMEKGGGPLLPAACVCANHPPLSFFCLPFCRICVHPVSPSSPASPAVVLLVGERTALPLLTEKSAHCKRVPWHASLHRSALSEYSRVQSLEPPPWKPGLEYSVVDSHVTGRHIAVQ